MDSLPQTPHQHQACLTSLQPVPYITSAVSPHKFFCPAGSLQRSSGRSHICHLCNETWRILASKLFESLESSFLFLGPKINMHVPTCRS